MHSIILYYSINIPLNDDLAVKLALIGRHSDGFVENTGEGEDFGVGGHAMIP